MFFMSQFLKKDFIYLFLEGEEGMGKDSEGNTDLLPHLCFGTGNYVAQPGMEPTTQAHAPTKKQTSNLSVYGMVPNQLSHTRQGYEPDLFTC